ncbi:glycosyltransferase family 4 protein [Saccharicrinis sp. FJH2]|uniref:glycosyltransferase family 4 protein n=1 Tax=Saccharicrinis sp. FJH65 TaxID=3344659 RepID=UPI0035F45882
MYRLISNGLEDNILKDIITVIYTVKQKKAVFLRVGSFSNVNKSILVELQTNFPDIEFEDVDIAPYINRKDLLNLFYCIKEYKYGILNRNNLKRFYIKTPYIFNKVKNIVHKKVNFNEYTFSFQTQSMFDFSCPDVPHFLYTDHTHLENLKYPGFDERNLASRKWIECEKDIYKNATLNFTMSENIKKSIINDYECSTKRVLCVKSGSNLKEDRGLSSNLNNNYSNKNILFVGINWERKGGPVLIEAFKKIRHIHPDATLTIVGCSPKLQVENCHIVGKIPLKDVEYYYKHASIFVLPTNVEPFGLVFIEAMANRLPIIGTNIGAIPEFIQENVNGYLVEPNNSNHLFSSILELIEHPERCKAFGECGYKIFKENYNWEKVGQKMCSKIKEVIE